jgi:hypothetical protein
MRARLRLEMRLSEAYRQHALTMALKQQRRAQFGIARQPGGICRLR